VEIAEEGPVTVSEKLRFCWKWLGAIGLITPMMVRMYVLGGALGFVFIVRWDVKLLPLAVALSEPEEGSKL
jgi:hypothetical protein